MTPARSHLLAIVQRSRNDLVRESTDIAFASGDIPIPKPDVEQMIRACVGLLEEALVGEATDVRDSFLDALPSVAKTTTWTLTMKNGLPCWGILIGKLVSETSTEHRSEAIVFLARFLGEWWSEVSKKMLPVNIAEGTL
jgi:hypothetical protein